MEVSYLASAAKITSLNRSIVSGLLVTGRQGAGKTSIVRAVSKSLQESPETLACTLSTLWFQTQRFKFS
jgi:Cdc6-like AAA superfamily ATPase